jgi:leucyl-tRNA synthetase
MAVPAHDQRDFDFALKYGLPVIPVIDRVDGAAKSFVRSESAADGFTDALRAAEIAYDDVGDALAVTLNASQVPDYLQIAAEHVLGGNWIEVVGSGWKYIFPEGVADFGSVRTDAKILERCKILQPEMARYRTVMEMLADIPFYNDVLFHADYGTMINSGKLSGTPGEEAVLRTTEWLESRGVGKSAVNYRLRDWLISRQRYWGTPIPIVYCEECGVVAVPYDDLPVLLPEDAKFMPTGESPLKYHDDFRYTTCPRCGGPAERELDTMDTFICSSWYQYAYLSPYYKGDQPFDPEEGEYWLPVDIYTGGIEHATMHLLYTRFYTMVMRDMGLVSFDEPMVMLRNQGTILGEDNEKMSKSRGNVISPDELVHGYGADTVRAYLMFGWRWNLGGPWDSNGIEGVSRFLDRVWNCVLGEPDGSVGGKVSSSEIAGMRRKLHQAIRKATEDMESFSFNTYIANAMELNNAMLKAKETAVYGTPAWKEAVEGLLLILAPACPHIAEELWARIGRPYSVHQQAWPEWDPELAAEETITLVVQVNGKVRDRVEVPNDIGREEAIATALATDGAMRHMHGKETLKTVYVPGRLVNIVVR